MSELWQAIPGWEGLYEASDQGRIRSLDRVVPSGRWDIGTMTCNGRVLSPGIDRQGYRKVQLCRDGTRCQRSVHQLVLEAFTGPRGEGQVACHNDGNPANNAPANLRWDTPSENSRDRNRHGTSRPENLPANQGELHPRAKLTWAAVGEIRDRLANGESCRALAREFGVTPGQIDHIKHERSWKTQ